METFENVLRTEFHGHMPILFLHIQSRLRVITVFLSTWTNGEKKTQIKVTNARVKQVKREQKDNLIIWNITSLVVWERRLRSYRFANPVTTKTSLKHVSCNPFHYCDSNSVRARENHISYSLLHGVPAKECENQWFLKCQLPVIYYRFL